MKLKTVVPATNILIQQLKVSFPGYSTDPIMQDSDHWGSASDDVRYICWEEGPYEWAMKVSNPDDAHYMKIPGIFLEPYNSFVLAVIPED